MSAPAIHVRRLSKQYRIGASRYRHNTLRDQLADHFNSWIERLRKNTEKESSAHPASTVWALEDVSFDVEQGEVVGIIGSNGAGKSTLLKLLSRITEPTSGRAEIFGRIGSLLEVGTGFDGELTGRENVHLSGAILGMKMAEINRKFDQIIDFAEIGKYVDTPVKRYSSGMYTRLAFAVAAHLEPDILLVDEVLAVGDAAFQKKCIGKMGEIRKVGRTVLFVSHNMAMIENLCPRTILLSHGHIVHDGPSKRAISKYLEELSDLPSKPLIERADRTGAGEMRIYSVEFLRADGKPSAFPVSGQELIIRVHYKVNSPRVFRNCRVSVSVHKDEHPYFLMSTELVQKQRLDLHGDGYIDFVIPQLPLSAGEYYVNPFIESNRVIQDWVTRAAALSVIDGDYYGTGRNYPPGWQGKCVLVNFYWQAGSGISSGRPVPIRAALENS